MKNSTLLNTLMVACIFAVSVASATSQTWEQLPYYYPQTVQSQAKIYTSPNDVLVAGFRHNSSPASHVSLDGGTTWQQIFSDKPITSVEFGPDGTIYFIASQRYLTTSTYYMDTLFTSTDGIIWNNTGYKLTGGSGLFTEYDFVVSANNTLLFPNHMDINGVFLSKSTDNGASWTPTAIKANPVSCSPNADTIITSFSSPWPGGINYSFDGGATTNVATGISVQCIPIRIPNGNVYAAAIGQMYQSTDGGASFTQLSLPSQFGHIQEFLYAANGKFYIRVSGAVIGIWETDDFVTFNALSATLPDWNLIKDIDVSNNYIYAVTDTNLYRCPLTAGTTTSIQNILTEGFEPKIYPNPVSDILHIGVPGNMQIEQMELTDLFGKVVIRTFADEKTLNLNQLPQGIYHLTILAGGNKYKNKVVVTR